MSLNYKGQNLHIDTPSKVLRRKILLLFMYILTKKLKTILKLLIIVSKVSPIICFSVKSNSNVSILTELGVSWDLCGRSFRR